MPIKTDGWMETIPPSLHPIPLLLLLPVSWFVLWVFGWSSKIPPHRTGQAGQQLAHFAVAASADEVACVCKMTVKRGPITMATTAERKSLLGFSPSTVAPPCSVGKCLGFWVSRERQMLSATSPEVRHDSVAYRKAGRFSRGACARQFQPHALIRAPSCRG